MKKRIKISIALLIVGTVLNAAGAGLNNGMHLDPTNYNIPFISRIFNVQSEQIDETNETIVSSIDGEEDMFTNVNAVDIDMDAVTVKIVSGDDWEVRYSSKNSAIVTETADEGKNTVLKLSQKYNDHNMNISDSVLELTVPKGIKLDALTMKLDAAKLNISDELYAKSFKLKGDASSADTDKIIADNIIIDGDASHFDINAVFNGETCSIDGDASSFDINLLKGSNVGQITAKCDFSSLKINDRKYSSTSDGIIFTDSNHDGIISIKSDAGNVKLNFEK